MMTKITKNGFGQILDLLEETCEKKRVRMAAYRQKVVRYHNSRVRGKEFKVGDLVPRQAEVSQPIERGKLSLNWEDPYQVDEIILSGIYRLKQLDGIPLPRPWNFNNLRMYYR